MKFPKKMSYSANIKNQYNCVGLDLSAKHCGISHVRVLNGATFLMNLKSIERNKHSVDKAYADEIVNEINQINPDIVICEDVYLKMFKGMKPNVREHNRILRIQGMVEYGSLSIVNYMGASHARPIVGMSAHANKSEIQALVYKMLYNKELPIFKEVDELRNRYKTKGICKATFNKHATSLSNDIYALTGINEHKADAIVLALAYVLELGG